MAEERGYFKLDLLNVAVYPKVKSEEHLEKLMRQELMGLVMEKQRIL